MAIETTSGSNALSSTLVASATTGRGVAQPAAKGDDANSEPTVVETARLAPSPEAEKPLARRHDDVEEEAVDPAAEKAPREFAKIDLVSDETRLSILYDQDIDRFVSRQVEEETGEVVRQFPYEEQVERMRFFMTSMSDGQSGGLDVKA